jgi:hypothetical protein
LLFAAQITDVPYQCAVAIDENRSVAARAHLEPPARLLLLLDPLH